MKNLLAMLVCAIALCAAAPGFADDAESGSSATQVNPALQFTGKYWVDSTETNKTAYIYGIDSAITVEYFVQQKMKEQAAQLKKKPMLVISPFEQGWMDAFRDMTRKQIVAEIDKWYADHPDQLSRPVLDVIWYELIEPRIKNK